MKTYDEMTFSELEALNQEFMAQRDKIHEEKRKISEAMNKKALGEQVRRKYSAMSDDEKKELSQIISSAGNIKSDEKVGTPGGLRGLANKILGR